MINWRVRIRNKNFWIAIVPAILLLVQLAASLLGFNLDLGDLGNKIIGVVNSIFAILAILGVVVDPTTEGINDSSLALTYQEPKKHQ